MSPQQSFKLGNNFCKHRLIHHRRKLYAPCSPIQVFDLVCQSNSGYGWIVFDSDFERVAFDLIRDRAKQCESGFAVVCSGREHKCRTMTGLFMPGLRIEVQPYDMTTIRQVYTSEKFLTYRLVLADLVMNIFRRDSGQKFGQDIPFAYGSDYNFVASERNID